ncbi:MAG: pilus assembly PilX N-terminal domain-containing protein [Tepidisphaeraceae bacterium]
MSRTYRPSRQRKGITAVMAMLYMVLFAVMALGFYATVTTSVALAKNDQRSAKALLAAESGVQFMRYHLSSVAIPPATPVANVMTELFNDLNAQMQNTGNLANGAYTVALTSNTIYIPSQSGAYVVTDATDNSGFAATITEQAGRIICKVVGHTGSGSSMSSKGVRLDYSREPIESNVFDNAVAARGRVLMQKGTLGGVTGISPNTIANIMSAKTTAPSLTMTGGTVGGGLGVVGSPKTSFAQITGGSVHGTSNITSIYNNYVNVVAAPEFPVIDTTIFSPYATNTYTGSETVLKNVRIPPNTNPTFPGNATIQGILYVESPNTINFRGNTNLQGFIVWENTGSSATNSIDMRGNFSHEALPAGAEFDALRAITGIAVLGPTANLTMSGSTDSIIKGNVIVGKFVNQGSADIQLDGGTLMGMNEGDSIVFNGKSVKWTSTGASNQPTPGVLYSENYEPVPGSYLELNQ